MKCNVQCDGIRRNAHNASNSRTACPISLAMSTALVVAVALIALLNRQAFRFEIVAEPSPERPTRSRLHLGLRRHHGPIRSSDLAVRQFRYLSLHRRALTEGLDLVAQAECAGDVRRRICNAFGTEARTDHGSHAVAIGEHLRRGLAGPETLQSIGPRHDP